MHPGAIAKQTPDKVAYLMARSGEAVTYRQLDERSNQGAQLFRSLGLKAGVDTGDEVGLVLRRASEAMPAELERLLAEEPAARRAWDGLTAARRRALREHVAAAKRPATRVRRSERALLGRC